MRGRKVPRKVRLSRSPMKAGRKPMKRTELKRKTGLSPGSKGLKQTPLKPKRKPAPLLDDRQIRKAWHDDVIARAPRAKGGPVCPVCGRTQTAVNMLQAHHVTTQEAIKRYVRSLGLGPLEAAERLSALLWDLRNGFPVCKACHAAHTSGKRRIPRSHLTAAHRAFAAEIGMEHLLDRYYPVE